MPRIKVEDETEPVVETPTEVMKTPSKPVVLDKTNELLKEKSGNPLYSAFCAFPKAIQFEGEEQDENLVLLLRAHLITNLKWILITVGLMLVPAIIFPFLSAFNLLGGVSGGIGLVFTLLWFSGTLTYAFINFLYWYFNAYIVTNERIVDIDWYSIIYHKINSTRISKLQDTSAAHSGVFASLFDYGNVKMETAAEESIFEFENVPYPDLVSQKIQELMESEEKEWEENPT